MITVGVRGARALSDSNSGSTVDRRRRRAAHSTVITRAGGRAVGRSVDGVRALCGARRAANSRPVRAARVEPFSRGRARAVPTGDDNDTETMILDFIDRRAHSAGQGPSVHSVCFVRTRHVTRTRHAHTHANTREGRATRTHGGGGRLGSARNSCCCAARRGGGRRGRRARCPGYGGAAVVGPAGVDAAV